VSFGTRPEPPTPTQVATSPFATDGFLTAVICAPTPYRVSMLDTLA
jgi:hypothetical protein